MTTGLAAIFIVPVTLFIYLAQGSDGVDKYMNKLFELDFLPNILETIFG